MVDSLSTPEGLRRARSLGPAGTEIRIGVSACLLGENVRFDGGHKKDAFVRDLLGPFVRYVPVCPEVEIGLGIPRESIHLARRGERLHLVGARSGTDHTGAMERHARGAARELSALDLCGFIFKKDSPSCGLHRVRVYTGKGIPARDGRGLFAAGLLERMPLLPAEEEGRLNDPRLRENFVERVFAYRRLKTLFAGTWRMADLVRFHTREKLLIMAHDPESYRRLGRLVAEGKGLERGRLASGYQEGFMAAMARMATRGRQTNTLQHAAGHLKKLLEADERQELADAIQDFRTGLIPLIVPITLLRHHARRRRVDYLLGQTYLEPHPKELMLRNHA